MRKYETKEKTITTRERTLTSVTCNCCGKVVANHEDFGAIGTSVDDYMIDFYARFGYGSRFDNESWAFDLCEGCFVNIVKTFRIAPSGFGDSEFYVADAQEEFEEWKAGE